jgi:hypothetical protein
MKTKELEALEKYIKTENEYFNGYALEILCEAIQSGLFDNLETPLSLFDYADSELEKNYKNPLKAVQLFNFEMDKEKLNPRQRLFEYKWVIKYLKNSVFGENLDIHLTDIQNLLTSQMEKMKADNKSDKPLTKNIRETLKELMQKELEALPETLSGLEPLQRLNVLCKLIPFVLPKVESVNHELNEPSEGNIGVFKW